MNDLVNINERGLSEEQLRYLGDPAHLKSKEQSIKIIFSYSAAKKINLKQESQFIEITTGVKAYAADDLYPSYILINDQAATEKDTFDFRETIHQCFGQHPPLTVTRKETLTRPTFEIDIDYNALS